MAGVSESSSVSVTETVENAGNTSEQEPKLEEDPYAYLNRSDFSSEKFKVEIKNLPKIYGIQELKKLLKKKLNLDCTKIKVPKRNHIFAFVCFRNEEDRCKAIETLSNYTWKGNQLKAIKAKPSPDPLVKKRREDTEDGNQNKKIKLDERSQEEKLKSSTIPLWNVPYEDQLKTKAEEVRSVLLRLGKELGRVNPDLREWLVKQQTLYNGLPCELLDIRYPTEHDGYRNKSQLSIGINEETNLPTVGFRIGSYVDGQVGVASVDSLVHIPEAVKTAAKLFQDFVRSSSLEVFNSEVHTGHFRRLVARTASDQLMLVVGIHPQQLTPEELAEFKKSVVQFFTEGAGKAAKVTSLYYEVMVKRTSGDGGPTAAEHLWGDTHICETVLDLKFKISPEAFFQINTKGVEVLYQSVIELAAVPENATVLDVCCGTGTIGLCFAKKCSKVLGLEVVPQAIADAKENARLNGIENAEFFAGKAEDILGTVCYRAGSDVTAIVDPPRAGLQYKAVAQLRKVNKISKLVYVSCSPASALKNFVDLGKQASKTLHNAPFVPVRAVAVDMFPHTKHCELVICFERFDKVKEQNFTVE